jgi:hypothetical protein
MRGCHSEMAATRGRSMRSPFTVGARLRLEPNRTFNISPVLLEPPSQQEQPRGSVTSARVPDGVRRGFAQAASPLPVPSRSTSGHLL